MRNNAYICIFLIMTVTSKVELNLVSKPHDYETNDSSISLALVDFVAN